MSAERFSIESPIGHLNVLTQDNNVTEISFSQKNRPPQPSSAFSMQVSKELNAYFNNNQHQINLPFKPQGTPFQLQVWQALQSIPAGKVQTYGELAKLLRSSPRAIGQACRNNPIPIIIPCHRIIGAKGLGGFVGKTKGAELDIKTWLLRHEGYTK